MNIQLNGKKVFFASDFHLGAPDTSTSKIREKKIIKWLESIEDEAAAIFLVGDIFDFWFEYKQVVPKGFVRFLGKIAELRDKNIPILFFTGNHDLWMKDYFEKELQVPVYHHPIDIQIQGKKLLVGHGDGLGPGDKQYKVLKQVFTNPVAQWMFRWLHPDIGVWLAQKWSSKSRISKLGQAENEFKGEEEWLWQYCRQVQKNQQFDFYIFGHRHIPLDLPVGDHSRYFNLGEWVSQYTYGVFDGTRFEIRTFDPQ
ncbi:UDP-2,3-diacylglucosamine diphosphatase [Arthrospiribacter ruber]|uniref:UDP-2,3-diacylglucosamine diphosphatase n=1 Tax=Arthrospiribacter ruber TaxID=2487934 RepID=A0A951IWL4_9BACT|nr:UDP-2,3-diacylglucosamine diphosphatase [Arthrospiribacter ruber]MBW3467086.1 UDP-2,3-diacylglucosamine diphosphatase [Arthrospiribacter ruber]